MYAIYLPETSPTFANYDTVICRRKMTQNIRIARLMAIMNFIKIPRWTLRGGDPIRKPFELFRKRWLECPTALKCRNIVILWCCNITFSCQCMTLKVKDSKNVDNIGYSWWRTFSRFHNWPLETPYRIVLHQNNHWAIFKEFMIILII